MTWGSPRDAGIRGHARRPPETSVAPPGGSALAAIVHDREQIKQTTRQPDKTRQNKQSDNQTIFFFRPVVAKYYLNSRVMAELFAF